MSPIRAYTEIAGRTIAAGDAHFNLRRGRLTASFSYDPDYIALPGAHAALREVAEAVEDWESVARRNGISRAEVARFAPTLSHTINAVRLN